MTTNFSIIIPYHNSDKEDRSQLLDQLMHTIPDAGDVEIILVDDRSSLPIRLTRKFRYTHVVNINNKPGRKFAGSARNTGIEVATGSHVIFADSDDLFDVQELARILAKVRNSPLVDAQYFRCTSFGKDENRHRMFSEVLDQVENGKSQEKLAWYCTPVGVVYRREFLLQNEIRFPTLQVAEDMVFTALVAASRPTYSISSSVAYKIREHQSLTATSSRQQARDRIAAQFMSNAILKRANMDHATLSIMRPLLRYAKQYPTLVFLQFLKAICVGQPMLPKRKGR